MTQNDRGGITMKGRRLRRTVLHSDISHTDLLDLLCKSNHQPKRDQILPPYGLPKKQGFANMGEESGGQLYPQGGLLAYFLFVSTEWTFHSSQNGEIHSGRNEMVHFILSGMEWAIPLWPWVKCSIPFWLECNGPFHSDQHGISHFIPVKVNLSIPTGMEWIISFWLEWIGAFHSGWNEITIGIWFHSFPTVISLIVWPYCAIELSPPIKCIDLSRWICGKMPNKKDANLVRQSEVISRGTSSLKITFLIWQYNIDEMW